MIQKLIFGIVGLVIVALVALYFVASSLINKGAMYAIETLAPEQLGVPVSVEDVSISPFSGQATLRGLVVSNPQGFDSPHAFSMGELSVRLDVLSVFSDVIRIEEIIINEPHFIFEQKLSGSNLSHIQDHLESRASEEGSDSKKKISIGRIQVNAAKIGVSTVIADADVTMNDIEIGELGGADGMISEKALIEVMDEVLAGVLRSAVNLGGDLLKDAGKKVDSLRDDAEGAVEAIKGLF